jgi:hypothetical protein
MARIAVDSSMGLGQKEALPWSGELRCEFSAWCGQSITLAATLAWPGNTDARTIPSMLIWLIDPGPRRDSPATSMARRGESRLPRSILPSHVPAPHNRAPQRPIQLQAEIARRSGTARLSEGIKMSWA